MVNPSRYHTIIEAPFGMLGIVVANGSLTRLTLLEDSVSPHRPRDDLAHDVCAQLKAYFRDPCHRFRLRLQVQGSVFQQRTWHALAKVDSGTTISYGQLANRLHTSARAVGRACRENPLPIIVPCHRVVARHGPGGYMGAVGGRAMCMKQWLLAHEQQ